MSIKKGLLTAGMLISLLVTLTGCWSSRELTDLAIVTAIGIDLEDEQYRITAQILNPSEIAGKEITSRTAVSTYSATGQTVFEAIRKLTTVAPRKLYLAHIRVVIFGEEYTRSGIADSLDFISRDHEMRTDFLFAIAKENKAEDVLKILTPLERIPANKIYTSLEASQEAWAPTKVVQLDELISSMTAKGKDAVLTGLFVIGDPDEGSKLSNVENVQTPTSIETDFLGVFKNDRLMGWLNGEQSKGFNYVTNNIKNTVGWIPCGDGGKLTMETIRSKTDMKGEMSGETPKIKIQTNMEVNIADVECVVDLNKQETLQTLEKAFEEKVKHHMESSIERAKEFEADIFGFGDIVGKASPRKWKEIEKQWSRIFAEKLETEIKVDVKIRKTGTITQSFFKSIEDKKKVDD